MRQYIVPVAIVLGVSIIASVAYDRFAYDGSIDTAAFLTAESDPVWGAVSNTVTTGAAAGATASQPGHAHAASSVTNGAATWVDVAGDTMNGDLNLGGNDATNAYLSGAYVAPVQFHDVALATAAGTTTVTCVLSPTSVVHVVRIAATGSSVVVKFDMTAPSGRKQRCDGLLVVSNGNSRTIQWADTWYTATNGSYSTSATPVFGVRGEIGFWTMNGYWYRTLAVTNVPAASFAW